MELIALLIYTFFHGLTFGLGFFLFRENINWSNVSDNQRPFYMRYRMVFIGIALIMGPITTIIIMVIDKLMPEQIYYQ